ncbi:MAG: amidohydrolase [Phycisphaerales bacterium]|nr:MAG: amidohydrolase [Phycisphaerales bacterium]
MGEGSVPSPAVDSAGVPGAPLREAHAHVLAHGRAMEMVQLAGCGGVQEALDAITQAASSGQSLVLAHGARPEAWDPPAWPTLAALDQASGSATVAIWCFDYHAMMVNSAALRRLGLDGSSPDPAAGQLGRTPDGRLTGVLYESAATAAWKALEPKGIDPAALRRAVDDLARHGFVQVHDLKSQPALGPALAELDRQEPLGVDLWLYPLVEDLPEVAKAHGAWSNERIRLAGGKIFVDGTLNSRTAWMLHPYADGRAEHPAGMRMLHDAQIDRAIDLCVGLGVQLAAHAIGDAAVRAVLDAVERRRPPRGTVRIEHAELIDQADVPRFAELGVIASVQPCHLLADIEALERACPDRLDRVLPLRELIDSGLQPGRDLLMGSDTPIVRPDPLDSIVAATQRRRPSMAPQRAVAPGQAIDQAQAWACFTVRG